jgi:hypothetical protein
MGNISGSFDLKHYVIVQVVDKQYCKDFCFVKMLSHFMSISTCALFYFISDMMDVKRVYCVLLIAYYKYFTMPIATTCLFLFSFLF